MAHLHKRGNPPPQSVGHIRVYAPSFFRRIPSFLRRDPVPIRRHLAVNKAWAPSGSVRSHTGVCSLPFPAAPSLLIPQAFAEGFLSLSGRTRFYCVILCRRDFVSINLLSAYRHRTESPRLPIRTPIFCGVILCRFGGGSAVKNRGPFPVKIRSNTVVCSLIFSGVPPFFPRRSCAEGILSLSGWIRLIGIELKAPACPARSHTTLSVFRPFPSFQNSLSWV